MSLLDLGSLAEGLQKGLLNYQQQQDRKRQIQNEAQDRANKNLEFQASLKKLGLLKDDSGNLQYDPVEQTKRTVDAYEGMDKLAKSGYFPKYDEKGLLSGFNEDPAKFKDYQNARKNPLEEELTRARINELNSQSTKNLRDKLAEGKLIPATSAENQGRAVASLGSLDALEKIINERKKLFGPQRGLLSKGKAYFELGQEGKLAKESEADIKRTAQEIGKYLEGGKLAAGDDIKYRSMLPGIGDSPEVAKSKIEGVRALIKRKQAGELDALKTAGYNVGGLINNLQKNSLPNEVSAIQKPETKEVGGKVYRRVPGKSGIWAEEE